MKLVQNKIFDQFIEDFKKLKLKDKQLLVMDQLFAIVNAYIEMDKNKGEDTLVLYNKEINDIEKEKYTQDDFAEAVYVYTYIIQELIASQENRKEDE